MPQEGQFSALERWGLGVGVGLRRAQEGGAIVGSHEQKYRNCG